MGSKIVVGIFALGYSNNLYMYAGFRRQLDRPLGRVQPGVVPVKGEHQFLGFPLQQPDLVLGQGGSRRGHDIRHACLRGGDGVEVTLHQDGMLQLVNRLARSVQVE